MLFFRLLLLCLGARFMIEVEINGEQVLLTMERLFAMATESGASDLHLKDACPPLFRVDGDIVPLASRALTEQEVDELAESLLDDRLTRQYAEQGTVDFAWASPGGDRFRINIFRQRGRRSVSCRRVNRYIPTLAELHMPEAAIAKLCHLHQGLIIFAGQTGCGKSTSIAACLEFINQNRACHVVTIEDPIEYLYEDKKAFISQREVGTDVESMGSALKFLMREDPDVVLIGEMRDIDTFEAAIRAAETGHLVFATLHAANPASAIGRILDLYPDHMQSAVRQNLAFNLAAIVCQILVPTSDQEFKRVPATEVLVATGLARKMIRAAEDQKLLEIIAGGSAEGMIDFTRSFVELISKGWISHQTAYEFAPNEDALRMALKGIAVKQGIIR
jgi:twitching motility protein PilT